MCVCVCVLVAGNRWGGGVEDCVCGGLVYWITGPQLIQVGIISNKMWNSFNTQAVGRYQCVWQRFMCPDFRFLFFVQIVQAGFTLTDTWSPPNWTTTQVVCFKPQRQIRKHSFCTKLSRILHVWFAPGGRWCFAGLVQFVSAGVGAVNQTLVLTK